MEGHKRSYGDSSGKKISTLYMTTKPDDVVVVAIGNDDTSLWHNRLGHMSQKEMKELLSKEKLPELKNIHFDMYRRSILSELLVSF